MIASNQKSLYAATALSSDTTTLSTSIELLEFHASGFILESIVTSRSAGDATVTLQHSPDGTNWVTVTDDENAAVTCATQNADGRVYKVVLGNVPVFPHLRASIVTANSADLTVEVKIHYGIVA